MRVRIPRRSRSRAGRAPVLQALERLNRTRLQRFRALLAPRAREVLDSLPLLLHLPAVELAGIGPLPGSGGVFGLRPQTRQVLRLTGDRTTALAERGRDREPRVLALYLMGSPGSISYNQRSDWDLWVCHAPALDAGARAALRQRLATLARWAGARGVALHAFLVDPERLRAGEVAALSEESSGSAQHYLLLDEFYRSAIRLAGQWPLWWLVPPERESEYQAATREIAERWPRLHAECLDLGGLGDNPAAEFLGAGVWQLAKSVGAPEKSLLKLMLIESYVASWPRVRPLALATKAAVRSGRVDADALDPYLQLYHHLEQYLSDDPRRLELVRRALYRKIRLPLSEPQAQQSWRHPRVAALVSGWGWDGATLAALDLDHDLPVEQVRQGQRELMRALTESYRRLSGFARTHCIDNRITAEDLHVLGRRLYAAFERRPGKVEQLGTVFGARAASEAGLVARVASGDDGEAVWALARARDGTVVKNASRCAELLAWCTINGIAGPATMLSCEGSGRVPAVPPGALRRALAELDRHLTPPRPAAAPLYCYAAPARTRSAVLLVNLERPPAADAELVRTLAAGADPLNLGAQRSSLAAELDLVATTSWEECLCRHATADPGPVLAEAVRAAGADGAALRVVAWGDGYAGALTRRLRGLIDEARTFLFGHRERQRARFVVELGGRLGVLERRGEDLSHRPVQDIRALWQLLCQPLSAPCPAGADGRILRDSPLPRMLSAAALGRIDVFVIDAGERLSVAVIDEFGAMSAQHYRHQPAPMVLRHLDRFLTSSAAVRARLGLQPLAETRYHAVRRDGAGRFAVTPCAVEPDPATRYLAVRVVGDLDGRGRPRYTVYCDDVEFSPAVHGAQVLSAAARHIHDLRRDADGYPVYVTEVDLSDALLSARHPQGIGTAHLLHYKRVIEERLNRAAQA